LLGLYLGLLLLILCYNDTPLNRFGGALVSPAFTLLVPFVAVGHVLRRRFEIWESSPLDRLAILFLLWCNAVGVLMLLWLGLEGRYEYLGESFAAKLVKLNCYYGFLYLAFRHTRAVFNASSRAMLALAFLVAVAVHAAIMLVEVVQMPDAFGALHGGEVPYNRIRLLSPEASTSGSVVVILSAGLLTLRGDLTRRLRVPALLLSVAFVVLYSILGQSKGYLLVVGASVLLAGVVQSVRRRSFGMLAVALLLGVGATAVLAPLALGNLDGVIRDTTTVITRGALLLAALQTALTHPAGTGFGPHEFFLTNALPAAINQITTVLPEASNFVEVDSYSTSNTGLFPKTAVAELLMLGGLLGAYVSWRGASHLLRLSTDRFWLRLALVFCLMSLATYINVLNKYDLVILAALIEHLAGSAQAPRDTRPTEAMEREQEVLGHRE